MRISLCHKTMVFLYNMLGGGHYEQSIFTSDSPAIWGHIFLNHCFASLEIELQVFGWFTISAFYDHRHESYGNPQLYPVDNRRSG
jgi:hypothetical protein